MEFSVLIVHQVCTIVHCVSDSTSTVHFLYWVLVYELLWNVLNFHNLLLHWGFIYMAKNACNHKHWWRTNSSSNKIKFKQNTVVILYQVRIKAIESFCCFDRARKRCKKEKKFTDISFPNSQLIHLLIYICWIIFLPLKILPWAVCTWVTYSEY